MRLSKRPESTVEYNGRRYKVNLNFDNVLRVFELQREASLSRMDKLDITVELLIGRNRMSVQDKAGIVEVIFREALPQGKGGTSKKTFDFVQDAKYIYASFWQAYGIDLHKATLHWTQFMALFEGLPNDTVIKEIIGIRLRPIPRATKHNAGEIKALMQAKATFALTIDPAEAERSFQNDLERFAAMVRGR